MLTRIKLPGLVVVGLAILFGCIEATGQPSAANKNVANERRADVIPQAAKAPKLPAQEILPFPPTPSASTAGRTMQDSVYKSRVEPRRLPTDAPNILVVILDDVGPAQASTFGGLINTPTMDRIAKGGITYNRFHTTGMCSPTRSALLCGRNHHRLANGQIAELANDWDGYAGVLPKSSATVAEVLRNYGYATSAFGKWHNTPAEQTTAAGPFEYWPTGYGFEYFYGMLAGEASQFEPCLVRNTTYVEHPRTSGGHNHYHLSEDLTDDAVNYLRRHKAFEPDRPFFMYWASGCAHGPFHVTKEWSDKYKGKFDDGWDKYRERAFQRAKDKGWIPANAVNTPRPADLPSWDSVPDAEKPFQRRLMEIYAGFCEHTDHEIGRLVDEVEKLGYGDNTLILYIWGDNGASAEGQNGTISELIAQNGIPSTIGQHIKALDSLGGLDVLGSPKTDPMYHAGWAWAGGAPYKGTKLIASHFGGMRNPMAVRWPARIKPDPTPRPQFHHVNDIVPTLYEIIGITPPRVVNGVPQDPIDGVSMAYTFDDAKAKGRKRTQYFEVMGSRSIYHDGWMASAFGPRTPWVLGLPKGIKEWTPDQDKWELYNLEDDWSQAKDLADKAPQKLAELKDLFLIEFARNNGFPIGGGLWIPVMHPELRKGPPYTEWTFPGEITRMPEFCAPALGNKPNIVTLDAEIPKNGRGVLYSLGGFSGGLSLYMKDGVLSYEYNLFEIQRTHIRAKEKLSSGKAKIEVETTYVERRPAGPLKIVIKVNGKEAASGIVPVSAPLLFTANDCLDIGIDLGSPVSVDYYDYAPFKFNGKVEKMQVKYVK